MKVLVINGSPKGDYSVTLQTMLYIEKHFKEHEFQYINAGSKIKYYEKNMDEAVEMINAAKLIIFSYPVYTFLVPSQLHRFVELMKQEADAGRLKLEGKYATQFSTSKHFYDVTAHRFIEENCADLKMNIIRGLSADMEDLTTKKGQADAKKFFEYLLWSMKGMPRVYMKEDSKEADELTDNKKNDNKKNESKKNDNKKSENKTILPVIIVADYGEDNPKLKEMIDVFCDKFDYPADIVNIREFNFTGGCMGCLRCASTGRCIYKDGFDSLLREKIQGGAAIMYAFTIKDHSMGSIFKTYDDRQFCNGHRTVTMGSPVGYLINGEYSKESNLKMVLEGRAEVGGNFFAGVASDENGSITTEVRDKMIERLANSMKYAIINSYAPPSNFLGVGGMKIFRDLIFQMRGFMKADHKFFKEHGQYDFPQKKRGTSMLMYLVGAMNSSEKMQKKMGTKMSEGMLAPYKKVLEEEN